MEKINYWGKNDVWDFLNLYIISYSYILNRVYIYNNNNKYIVDFNRGELELLKMFKGMKYNYSVRFTPRIRKSENWESKIWSKLSLKLKGEGYNIDGYVVRDIGKSSYSHHYHSLIRVDELVRDKSFQNEVKNEEFKFLLKGICERHDLDLWIEDYKDDLGGYEEYCVSKIRNTSYWIESFKI